MSLVATWCRCADGNWYSEPVWAGPDPANPDWFLCLDDDDPPEVVVKKGADGPTFPWFKYASLKPCGSRIFTMREAGTNFEFTPARHAFGSFKKTPPVPNRFDQVRPTREGIAQGVFYEVKD